ncbi:3-oxoadipyl-CoA thiolase [Litorilituus lipolyticus]|uniref:Beta-ketoadipyl-CoA thiolase n=1 Tax=Litorilituus lipolyticus TaxID=2491017 RepID=A0A502KR83_9GAMM|nr:3-oxoadipyl-CoA thiolase [Litorilituus lipolyticus]TPH12501.1 3-oxoadipyl-CoA thiolase [Litorilituus lipolyticus]
MKDVYLCDGIRTPIGRYGGSLASVRADDLAAIPLKALKDRNPQLDFNQVDDVILGCANQAGEDNRNIARMSLLLAEYPMAVAGTTINRLCGSGMNAIAMAANNIKAGEGDIIIAGGVEAMTRAPYVIGKADSAFGRSQEMFDTTMGWRFVNKKLDKLYGTETMPETAENVAEQFNISREDQDKFAFWSQSKAKAAQEDGRLAEEIVPVIIPQRRKEDIVFDKDEHLRLTPLDKLATLKNLFREPGTVTAGNASGINDGAAAVIVASKEAALANGLTPKAKIVGSAVIGIEPRVMGIGPAPASEKLLKRLGLSIDDMDIIEFNEAFAAQALASARELGIKDNDERLNPQGGAIALGHPLGMSGTRIVLSAMKQLERSDKRYALCAMCIGVGQGIAMVIEKV